jgi:toxin ParE1/3/4
VPTKAVALHEQASADYDATFDWYLERSPEAALKFDAEVERAIAEIAHHPRRWVSGSHGTRRFLLRGFPFLLIYRERNEETIEILAVAHTSRRPAYWESRL